MLTNSGIRFEFKFPLLLLHTPYGLKFFDRVAKTKIAKVFATLNIYFMPIVTILAIFLFVGSMIVMFSNFSAREGVRDLGPQANILLPGLNPYLPWTYGWAALIITMIVHEAGHGIIARVHGVKVDSTGVVFLLIIPIGAFVNIGREELMRTNLKQKSSILTAGIMNNMIVSIIALVLLFAVISTLNVVPNTEPLKSGILVIDVNQNSLAEKIGITKESIITSLNGISINKPEELRNISTSNLGKTIPITWVDKNKNETSKAVTLPSSAEPGKGIFGISISSQTPDPQLVLDAYKNSFFNNPLALLLPPTLSPMVPYSDIMAEKYYSPIFGSSFPIFANMFFWLWFINFNVGIFNALPIGPLDGGQLYNSVLESKFKSRRINPGNLLTYFMVGLVIITLVIPWILI
ncbi:MAG: hypothetical protein DA328_01750 [Nitrososphaeraceae archaeon]|nr:hypothetical protein [Nitrososphaeraceae archaeon]